MASRSRLPLFGLRAFEAAARLKGVRRGAAELFVTEGAVSQQIRSLETMLGVKLFVRGEGRHIVTTEKGQVLLRGLTVAFDLMESAIREVQSKSGRERLRVRSPPTLAIRWLVPLLGEFYERHRDVEMEVSTTDGRISSLLPEDDFVIWHGRGDWKGVYTELLFRDELLPVCSPALAAKLAQREALADVPRLHSIFYPEAWQIWLERNPVPGLEPTTGLRFASASLAYQGAIDGLGVAVAQLAYVREDLRSGRLIAPFMDPVQTDKGFYLICDQAKAPIPRYRAFIDWIADQVSIKLEDP